MCVWQSHACSGTWKFTGVTGCEAFANAASLRSNNPVERALDRMFRRVSMGDLRQYIREFTILNQLFGP